VPFSPDSTTAGYLGPQTTPLDGDAWVNFLHDVVAGVTGLPNDMVRPRWQAEPPNYPNFGVDWVAIGITDTAADWSPAAVIHNPDADGGLGTDEMRRVETVTLLCTFYGINSTHFAATLRDGLIVDQNRAVFRANGIGLVEMTPFVRQPELVRQRYWDRTDTNVILRREVRRVYNVRNIVSVHGVIKANDPGRRVVNNTWNTVNEE
jgi:hypothetical protein